MIKLNVGQMVDYPLHSSVFVMDLAVLLFHRPPFLFSLAMFALLLWLTVFFVVNSERSERFRVVFERSKAPAAKPAVIAAPVVEAPAPAPVVEPPAPAPTAAVEAPAVAEAPAAAVAEAKPAAPSRSAGASRRGGASSRRKG